MRRVIAGIGIFLVGAMVVEADTIIIKEKQYSDVLIYESSSYYYVKLPREGKSLSVRKSDVPENQVQINEDPYYREQLRDLFEDVTLRGEAALLDAKPIDYAFTDAPPPGAGAGDAVALLSGGGGGKPMTLSVAAAQELFAQAQISLTKSGDNYTGKTADGVMSIRMTESGGQVSSISGSIESSNPASVQGKVMSVLGIAGKVAPWSTSWMMSSQQTLAASGSIKKTQDGVGISIQVTSTGGISFSIRGE